MMGSGPRDDAIAREKGNKARRRSRITYSREFLLSVGGSEACRDNLPAGIDALRCMGLSRMMDHGEIGGHGGATATAAGTRWVARSAAGRSRGRHGDGEGSPGRAREPESSQTCVGSKLKPCTRFFSTVGCHFGESCRFLHYFPGGHHQAASKMNNLAGGPAPAHHPGQRDLGKHKLTDNSMPLPPLMGQKPTGHLAPRSIPNDPAMATPASFGASATAKISVDASLAGAIIGRGGVNIKQISRASGAKLRIRDHKSDASLNNVELEGTFDQIKNASAMVMEVIGVRGNAPPLNKNLGGGTSHRGGGPGSKFKTKLCEQFAGGSCSFGDRCRFAHGGNELRRMSAAAREPCGW